MVRTVLVFSLVADDVGNFLQNQRFEHRQQIKQNQQVIFIKLRSAPELDLMPPMEANLLIMIVRIVRSIERSDIVFPINIYT
jgi:septum formation topological specificity factor MinE